MRCSPLISTAFGAMARVLLLSKRKLEKQREREREPERQRNSERECGEEGRFWRLAGQAQSREAVKWEREAERFANGCGPSIGSFLAPAHHPSATPSPAWELMMEEGKWSHLRPQHGWGWDFLETGREVQCHSTSSLGSSALAAPSRYLYRSHSGP